MSLFRRRPDGKGGGGRIISWSRPRGMLPGVGRGVGVPDARIGAPPADGGATAQRIYRRRLHVRGDDPELDDLSERLGVPRGDL